MEGGNGKKGIERFFIYHSSYGSVTLPSISSRQPRQQSVIRKDKLLTERGKVQKEKLLSNDLINELLLPNNFKICHLVRIRKSKEKTLRAYDILIIGRAEVNYRENSRSLSSFFIG